MRDNYFASQLIVELLLFVPIALSPLIPRFVFADLLTIYGSVVDTFVYAPALIASRSLTVLLFAFALYYAISRIRYLTSFRSKTSSER